MDLTPEDMVRIILGERNVADYHRSQWQTYEFYNAVSDALDFDSARIAECLRAKARAIDPWVSSSGEQLGAFDVEMAITQDLDLGTTQTDVARTLVALADAIERHGREVARVFEERATKVGRRIGVC